MQYLYSYRFRVTTDLNDKNSIYFPDLIGAQLGIKEAKDNIRQFLEREETKIQKIKDDIPNMINLINAYFGGKQ
jgi:hypothetical protein